MDQVLSSSGMDMGSPLPCSRRSWPAACAGIGGWECKGAEFSGRWVAMEGPDWSKKLLRCVSDKVVRARKGGLIPCSIRTVVGAMVNRTHLGEALLLGSFLGLERLPHRHLHHLLGNVTLRVRSEVHTHAQERVKAND